MNMSKKTARQHKQEQMKKIMVSSIALLLVAVLLIGFVTMAVHAVETPTLNITVTNGDNPVKDATVTVKQVYDHTQLNQDNVDVVRLGGTSNKGGGCQGGGFYDHYFVQVEKGSGDPMKVWFHIFDLKTNKQIAEFTMDGDTGAYKNNNANFGTEFYDENDPFPLLYISSAYDYRTVAVRIYQDGEEWKAQQVQVIDYSETFNNANGYYSCNILLDIDNNFMYLTPINATYTDLANCTKQWFYKFEMPTLADGAVVKVGPDDAIAERVETAYEFAPQGGFLKDGIVYQSFGYGSTSQPGKLGIFDLNAGEYITKINLNALGCGSEPESAGYYNGSIYFVDIGGGLWKVSPKKEVAEENNDTLNTTLILDQDANWEKGFLESVQPTFSLNPGQEHSNYGNKIYRSGLIDVSGNDYIYIPKPDHFDAENGGYYKWKLYFYGENAQVGATTEETIDFVSCAAEQSDFSTTNKFSVPEGAKYVRICVASVLASGTQATFPEASFLNDGGLTVQMYTAAEEEEEEVLTLDYKETATTTDTGIVGFNPPEGAFIRVTVTAEGYKTATGTFSATEYAAGLNVKLVADTPDVNPEDGNLNIFVTDGVSSITGATVKIEQTSNSSSFVPVETEATLLDTIDLTNTAAWKQGYFNVSSSSPGTIRGQETNPNAKIFRTDLIPVEGSEYITLTAPGHYDSANGGYYKWRLLWYGTNSINGTINNPTKETVDFVGFSSEQTDLSQHTQFAVPEGACYVRIAIASVKNGSAEGTFPVSKFCNDDGGLKVNLYRDEATVKVDNLKETGYLEVGGIDATTGAFVTNALHCRTNAPFSTMGASMLAVSFPATESVSYKWQVLFYNNNNFVSASAEQTGLDTHVYFDIPEDANEYKIAFTSVVGGVDTAIDLPAFCQNGGFNVTLYGADLAQKEEWITKEGTTDENGLVSFEVPAGANYKITVTKDGYVETSLAVTPDEYADVVTLTMEKEIEYSDTLDITVNNGSAIIPGATVKVEQILDSSLLRQDTTVVEKVGGSGNRGGGCQGGGIYDHYFVQVEKGSGTPLKVQLHIYDLNTNRQIALVALEGDGGQYKNNNANFGTEFYDENDLFPLLYISSAYDARTVAVRIYQDNGEWKAQQVQVIDYSEDFSNANGFYSCNVLLDNENGFMYLTPINATYTSSACTKQWFYKFNMPKLSDGYRVIIDRQDALTERIETAYEFAPQGACIVGGKVYQVFGGATSGKLGIFNLATGEYETKINLYPLGYNDEPESVGFYNGSFYGCGVGGGLYKITPKAYIKETPQVPDILQSTITLNKDADWEVGFMNTPGVSGALDGQETQQGNKIYRTGLIDVSGCDYIYIPKPAHFDAENGGYYKWKVYFYGPNAQLGATTEETIDFISVASETSDFSTANEILIPIDAKYARIAIASVLSSGTQQTFPESTFLEDGGMTVQFYESAQQDDPNLWVDKTVTTDENGNIKLDVVPGASFNVTVSAPGYVTVTKTITAVDYLNGTTVTLTAVSLGDTNGDGSITAADATLLKQYRAGLVDAGALDLDICDLDGNGKIDAYDAYLIQLYVAGIIDSFPCEG